VIVAEGDALLDLVEPMPPTRLTVPVKYRSITSFDRPTASKIRADW
jgi:hypothetical protein